MNNKSLMPKMKNKQQDETPVNISNSQLQAIAVASFMVDPLEIMEENNE
tara:strand:+ start:156 stop:302 length:147 start_codon:yes stop_codon:yes gene_type:complete